MDFKLDLPELYNAADYFVDRNIREGRGSKTAVLCDGRATTYAEIQAGMNRFGNALRSLGIRMEERVALMLLDSEIYPQVFFGAIKIGAVPICLNTLIRPKDFAYFLNDSRARVLVIDTPLLGLLQEIRSDLQFLESVVVVHGTGQDGDLTYETLVQHQPDTLDCAPTGPDDACFWLYSSGSTGRPKGTVHLQHDMMFAAETYGRQVLGITASDICFSAAKLFFAYGLGNGLYFPFSVGATAVYLTGRPAPEAVFETIEQYRPTIFFGVPTLFGYMLAAQGAMPSVKFCVSAGEALPPDIFQRWKKRFNNDIIDGIGSTEMVHIYISNRRDQARPGSTGTIVPGYQARIVNEHFQDVPDGEIGTLLVEGDSAAAYYWNKHEKTKETMLGPWLNTGDKFFRDQDGFYFYVGRTNDMLKVGGIWVSPIEVEACVIEHEDVMECAVIGVPDPENLIKPMACVVLNDPAAASPEMEKKIKEYVKTRLAHYKYPRWITFMDELPKTATGKIKRFELKAAHESGFCGT